LLELTENLDLHPSSTILDLGCGRGLYTVELATRYGCRVVAIDPVIRQVQNTERLVAEAGLRERVTVHVGSMESIPLANETVDFIWCGGVLVHIADIDAGLTECRRVLRPHASLLLFTAFATDLLEPREAQRLYDAMSFYADSMRRDHVEQKITAAGFHLVRSESLGSEFAEYAALEDGHYTNVLLRLARLQRQPERFASALGPAAFHTAIGRYHWIVYQFLGKISFHVFLLQKSS
jgi:cyclopropane fatty-acyl-phospholipid synthase-like methyltransferase